MADIKPSRHDSKFNEPVWYYGNDDEINIAENARYVAHFNNGDGAGENQEKFEIKIDRDDPATEYVYIPAAAPPETLVPMTGMLSVYPALTIRNKAKNYLLLVVVY